MSKKLARLQCLPCDFRDSLQGTGILGSAQILELSINDLESYIPALQLNTTMFSAIKADIAAEVAPKTKTAQQLQEARTSSLCFLNTPLSILDAMIGGGWGLGSIYEIAGASGSGKTQWALTSACGVLLDLPSSHVLYIDSEQRQLAEAASSMLQRRLQPSIGAEPALQASIDMLTRLHMINVVDSASLLEWCAGLETTCLQHNVKLVVIDSVASAVRGCSDAIERQKVLMQLAAQLKVLGEAFGFAVLVTNQVHESSHRGAAAPSSTAPDGEQADLGIAWSHAINTRLMLSRAPALHASGAPDDRLATITKCPCAPRATVHFATTGAGVMLPADAIGMGFQLD